MKSYIYLVFSVVITLLYAYYCQKANPSVLGYDYPFVVSDWFLPVFFIFFSNNGLR